MIEFNLLSEHYDVFLKILVTVFLTGFVGLEREMHGRAAGFRTNILVGLGACVFTVLSISVSSENPGFSGDPGRIAAQIVTGIGFLGAGAIIKYGFNIKGLTTASCLWIVAAIGMASGSGQYFLAFLTTIVSVVSLLSLKIIEKFLPIHYYRTLIVTTEIDDDTNNLIDFINTQNIKVMSVDFKCDYKANIKTEIYKVRIFKVGLVDHSFNEIRNSLHQSDLKFLKIKWISY